MDQTPQNTFTIEKQHQTTLKFNTDNHSKLTEFIKNRKQTFHGEMARRMSALHLLQKQGYTATKL